ncbi:MAG TPA: hypothetical protein VD970_08095 [Acetobacteraceae bacterium]|nr:hypothetical protein [Acetobacteraceae bacterium]
MRVAVAVVGLGLVAGAGGALAQMQPRDLGPPAMAPAPGPPPTPAPAPAPSPAPAPAPAPGAVWQTLETQNFGQWTYSALRHSGDGTASCAIHTHWHETGRQLRLVAFEQPESLNLALADPRWTLREGASSQGTIAIDAASFTATFNRAGPTVLSTQLASTSDTVRRFLQSFRAGNTMRVTLPGDSFVAGLRGSSAAITAMTRCIERYFGTRAPLPSGPVPAPGPRAAPPTGTKG